MFNEPKTLIVVYKDEMLVNQIKKLVETKDDKEDGTVIGTKDDSIKIVPWTEKVWLDNKKKGTIDAKVLFLGDIKGVNKLTPVLDVKFDKYGTKYGWAGDQAVIYTDIKELNDKTQYVAFLETLNSMPVPEIIKKTMEEKGAGDMFEDLSEMKNAESEKEDAVIDKVIDTYVQGVVAMSAFLRKIGSEAYDFASDLFKDKNAITRQQMFYGVLQFYNDDLERFMQG